MTYTFTGYKRIRQRINVYANGVPKAASGDPSQTVSLRLRRSVLDRWQQLAEQTGDSLSSTLAGYLTASSSAIPADDGTMSPAGCRVPVDLEPELYEWVTKRALAKETTRPAWVRSILLRVQAGEANLRGVGDQDPGGVDSVGPVCTTPHRPSEVNTRFKQRDQETKKKETKR